MAAFNGSGINGLAHCVSSLAATSGESLGGPTSREDNIKSQFTTREGIYRMMAAVEYRPNRIGYSTGANPPVRVSFVVTPDSMGNGQERICFNVGRELFVYNYGGLEKPADMSKPVDKRTYKGTFPTCHDFNPSTAALDSVLLLIGFSAGQIQLIDPIKKEFNKLFNEERMIDKSKVTCLKWVPGSVNAFVVCHASGQLYVYKEELMCGNTPPSYQIFKQGDGYNVFTCKAKSTRNPLYRWVIGEGSLNELAFSPCTKYMATVSQDGFLRVFKYDTMDLVGRMRSYFGGLLCVAWSPDSRFVAVGGEDDLITVWSMAQKRVVARGQGHRSWISVIAFDPFCTMYRENEDAAASEDETLFSGSNSPSNEAGTRSSAITKTSNSDSQHITSYRIGSVGQDTHLCLWDLTDDVLRQPVGRSRTSILLHSPASHPEAAANSLVKSGVIVTPTNGPVDGEGPSGTIRSRGKEHRGKFTLGSKNSDKNNVNRSSNCKTEDPNKLLGTAICPSLEEVPMLEPLVCKKISHERLTALVFREDSYVIACQEGFVSTWARPGFWSNSQMLLSPAASINDDEEASNVV